MRLVDNDLRSQFNSRLGNPSQGWVALTNPVGEASIQQLA